MMKVSKKH